MEKEEKFRQACEKVSLVMERNWRAFDDAGKMQRMEREKRAIMGYEEDMRFYKEEIHQIIRQEELSEVEPPIWYPNLEEGIFAELYGLAGLAPWVYDQMEVYKRSPSAKLIGERLYCMIDGRAVLQPQKISRQRREQLKRALLMATPKERMEQGFHEIYLHNGIRLTIFSGEKTKDGQDVMVFRKYIMQSLDFQALVELETIPPDAPDLFRSMIRIGFNVLIAGPVRSGKTTFLEIWQCCEDPSLEGIAISTDPEIPWHKLMPDAPLMQIVADGKELEQITKPILRGDCDYMILEEMRDASAYRLALDITALGARRCKGTVHTGNAVELPYKMASAISSRFGGETSSLIRQVFSSYHYVMEFMQDPENPGAKKLKAVVAYCYDEGMDQISVHKICEYVPEEKNWRWHFFIGTEQEKTGALRPKEMNAMKHMLKQMEKRNPIMGHTTIYPRYYHPNMKKGGVELRC